jgi:hypothetical protein
MKLLSFKSVYNNILLVLVAILKLYEKTSIFLVKQHKTFILSIILGLFLAAFIDYFIPQVRYLSMVLLSLFLLVGYTSKYKDVFFVLLILFFFMILNLYANYTLQNNFDFSYFQIYLMIFIGYILAKDNIWLELKPYIKAIILINLVFLISEKLIGSPIVPYSDGRDNLSILIYGQGIFGYTKNAAAAIAFSVLLFRKEFFWKFIILISVAFIGVRAAILFVILIIVIDLLLGLKLRFKMTIKGLFLGMLFLIISSLGLYYLGDLFYFGRMESLLSSDSTAYTSRFYYAIQHLNYFSDLGVFQLLFGSGTYCPTSVGNGSENLHIMLFTHFGIVNYILWLSFFILIIFTNIRKNFYVVYPLGLYLLLGLGVRWGMSWMSGILLYSYLFSIYFKRRII